MEQHDQEPEPVAEIQLISDGDGLAIIGDSATVDLFLESEGLASRDLGLPRLRNALGAGGIAAQAGSEIAANSGRWVQLTKESAGLVKKYGLRESSKSGLTTGVVKGSNGQIKTFVEFTKGPGSLLTNPAILSGAAGIMAQAAMQQTMDDILEYLATIDEKLDDVLRAQTNQVLSRLDGVDLAVKEAMSVRDAVGRVSEVTWSKVQASSMAIGETQAYALRQLNDLAEKVERKTKIGDLANVSKQVETDVQKWLAVLAHCFQLQDAVAVLELDRVLDASPDELDRHRLGLRAARQTRLELISHGTEHLLTRMIAAAEIANSKVLVHPNMSPEVVRSSNNVVTTVSELHGRLGIEDGRGPLESKQWGRAAAEVRDKAKGAALETKDKASKAAAEHAEKAKRFGDESLDRARRAKDKLTSRIGGLIRHDPTDGTHD
jgi:hypothetical protein